MNQTDSQFTFAGYEEHITRGNVQFYYTLADKGNEYNFTETLSFSPPSEERVKAIPKKVLTGILETIHFLLGISYWKTVCPKLISIRNNTLTRDQAEFWNTVYTKGLGEFFFRNSLDFRGLIQFPYISTETKQTQPRGQLTTTDRVLLLLGAGKDSIVSAELLKKYKKEFTLYSLNEWAVITAVSTTIGAPLITIKRTIDPKLFELNSQHSVYNGHVPVTAIFSLTALFASILYDFRYVIASNEASASYGNVNYLGSEINHQWSKSFEFEILLQEYVSRFITSDIKYFSLLRPLTELHITNFFSSYTKYFSVFTSCNKNFKLLDHSTKSLWCGECPKCAFVFLLLGAFLPRDQLIGIFHKNLFENRNLVSTYKELLGFEGFKPFECVGTPEESLYAFETIIKRGEFANDVVVASLSQMVQKSAENINISFDAAMSVSTNHRIPEEFSEYINAI